MMDVSWVTGFLSGIGFAASDGVNPLGGLDVSAVKGWMDDYSGSPA
jgi:hypothetical protein